MAQENGVPTAPDERRWHWRDSQEEIQARFPRERPTEPVIGSGWWDEASRCLCVWDGRQWVGVPLD